VQAFAVEPSASQQRWAGAKVSRGEYARQRRVQLCAVLSPDGNCAVCDENVGHDALTIDHVDGCTWNKTRVNAWMRAARYWREYQSGVKLRAICGSCNSSMGQQFRGRRRWS
jgi:hypothetical protein